MRAYPSRISLPTPLSRCWTVNWSKRRLLSVGSTVPVGASAAGVSEAETAAARPPSGSAPSHEACGHVS